MEPSSWTQRGTPAIEGFGGYEIWAGLEPFEPKYEFPANLTVFTQWAENADDETELAPPDEGVRTRLVAFQGSLADKLGAVCKVMAYGRFWHAGVCQMEFRVDEPEKANELLQAIIETEDHAFPFEFQIFPDGRWLVPRAYWTGAIANPKDEGSVGEESEEGDDAECEAIGSAMEAIEDGELARAVELLKEHVAGDGAEDPQTWEMLCDCLAGLAEFEEAMQTGHKGLERFPNEPRLLRALSTTYFLANDLEGAEAVVVAGLKADSLDPALHHQMACIRVKQGRMEEAVESVRICARIEPFRKLDLGADDDLAPLRDLEIFRQLTDPSDLAMIIGGRHTENPHEHFLVIELPDGLEPGERAERIEEPLGKKLAASGAGTILGGATRIHPGQSNRESLIEVGTDTMDSAVKVISDFLMEAGWGDRTRIFPNQEIGDTLNP